MDFIGKPGLINKNFKAFLLCIIVLMTSSVQAMAAPPDVAKHNKYLTALMNEASPVELNALKAFESGDRAFKEKVKQSLSQPGLTLDNQIILHYFLAIVNRKDGEFRKSLANLRKVKKLLARKGSNDLRAQMIVDRRLADCYYEERKIDLAISHYLGSLLTVSYFKDCDLFKQELLESLAGCFLFKKDNEKAIFYLKQLKEEQEKAGAEATLFSSSSYFWTLLQLAQAYAQQKDEKSAAALQPKILNLLDRFIALRMKLEAEDKLTMVTNQFLLEYISKQNPRNLADYMYVAYNSRTKLKALPLIAWRDKTNPIKAAIVCVHGMGLENRAFTFFGREMAKRGFLVCAVDVRGFGSWLAAPGRETIDFAETIDDIKFVIDLVRDRTKNLPVFVLGESMGGAIALRTAAKYDGDISGVIASVPSAERFQEKRMALDVALHFLKNPSKPYAMMDTIAHQATSRPELLSSWSEDMRAKLKVSPKELIRFAVFMRRTERACKKIHKTPAFLVQGLKDALVKPQGTFRMFEHIKTNDKDMFILGTAEHLIFETDLQNEMLLDTLTTWLSNHIQPGNASDAN